jgi:hypothetical protein
VPIRQVRVRVGVQAGMPVKQASGFGLRASGQKPKSQKPKAKPEA